MGRYSGDAGTNPAPEACLAGSNSPCRSELQWGDRYAQREGAGADEATAPPSFLFPFPVRPQQGAGQGPLAARGKARAEGVVDKGGGTVRQGAGTAGTEGRRAQEAGHDDRCSGAFERAVAARALGPTAVPQQAAVRPAHPPKVLSRCQGGSQRISSATARSKPRAVVGPCCFSLVPPGGFPFLSTRTRRYPAASPVPQWHRETYRTHVEPRSVPDGAATPACARYSLRAVGGFSKPRSVSSFSHFPDSIPQSRSLDWPAVTGRERTSLRIQTGVAGQRRRARVTWKDHQTPGGRGH